MMNKGSGQPGKESIAALQRLENDGISVHVVGGTVRDLLLGKKAADLDLAVPAEPLRCAQTLRRHLGGGTLITLSQTPGEEAVRLVRGEEQIDIAGWRSGADGRVQSLDDDLLLRDFSINAMALTVADFTAARVEAVIDPAGGAADLAAGRLRSLPGAFAADPLRMVRSFRFYAELGFALTETTRSAVGEHAAAVDGVAIERVSYELQRIFDSPRTAESLRLMAETGLLRYLLPELYRGEGVRQPAEFHHLDVLGHSFAALEMAGEIAADPQRFIRQKRLVDGVERWLAEPGNVRRVKWAALLHDLGKPGTRQHLAQRITFHGHDRLSCELFRDYARRSRWSGADRRPVETLIARHMYPFHLLGARSREQLSRKGILRFTRRVGDEFFGLLVVSLADVLAGNPKHHAQMQQRLLALYAEIEEVWQKEILPVTGVPPLLGGNDLLALGLSPGPLFKKILTALEEAQVAGEVRDVSGARAFALRFAGEAGVSLTKEENGAQDKRLLRKEGEEGEVPGAFGL